MKPALLVAFFLSVLEVFCQVATVDSIASLIDNAKTVRERIEILNSAASFMVNADLKRSIDYAEQARNLAIESKDDIGLAHAALNGGKYYTRVGMYEKAMENYILALKISESKTDESLRGLVYKVMGNNYYFKHDYKMAKYYYKRALVINEKYNDEETTADLLNNIALIMIESKELDSASDYLNPAVRLYEKLKKPGKLANTLLNIGLVNAENGQYEEAINFYEKALAIDQAAGLTLQEGATLNNIASCLIKLGKTREAETNLKKALAIGERENFRSLLVNVYHNLAIVGKGSKNFPVVMEQLLRMKDSLHSEQNSKLMEELRTKYESDQKEKENQHLLAQSEANEKQLMFAGYLIFFIALFAIVVTTLAIVYYRLLVQNRKARKELSVLNIQIQQQARDLKIANDEIAAINENLHGIVVEKSSTIDEQNERLVEYTFHNSHRVRGPLTRILALIDLVKIGEIQQEEMEFVLNEIDRASNELDHVLREINTTLNNDVADSSELSG